MENEETVSVGENLESVPVDTELHWQAVDKIYGDYMSQAEKLKTVFPGFDLSREVRDDRFLAALKAGLGMEQVFYGLHGRELLGEAMAYAVQRTKEGLAASCVGVRPGENGLSASGAVKMGSAVDAMTADDYASVCRRVERGERVSFG